MGLVLAESQSLAHQAALKVQVEYSSVQKPRTDMREIIASGDKARIKVEREPEHVSQGKLAVFTGCTVFSEEWWLSLTVRQKCNFTCQR